MSKALLAMGDSTKKVAPLLKGLKDRELFFSLGEAVPDLSGYDVSYWMAGLYATKLQHIGLATRLASPGPEWLAQVDTSLTGRTIFSGTLDDLQQYGTHQVWVKPAEAKINDFAPCLHTYEELKTIYDRNGFGYGINLQWCEQVLNLDYEHRFFIQDGTVTTGSPYKVGDIMGYYEGIDTSKLVEAWKFADHVTSSGLEAPPAYVLDVALNVDTGHWLVVEANRSWSAGIYGCDPVVALESVEQASHYEGVQWLWVPDEHLKRLVVQQPSLTVEPVDTLTLQFFKYENE